MKKLAFFGGVAVALGALVLLAGPYGGGNGPYPFTTLNGNIGGPGYLYLSAPSTNYGVLSTNANNILLSSTNDFSVFTNAAYAVAIGSVFPKASILGNGIWIGGGGSGQGGSVGTNSIAIGAGAGAFSQNALGIDDQAGAIAIGNQVDCFASGSTVICAAGANGVNLTLGSRNSYFIGNANIDNGNAYTNVFMLGNHADNLTLANNTWYAGNGGGGGTNEGRTRNFVFLNGGAYPDDGSLKGNGYSLTNLNLFMPTNTITGNGGVVDMNVPFYVITTATNWIVQGIANIPTTTMREIEIEWTNSSGAAKTVTWPAGTQIMTPNATNQPLVTLSITNSFAGHLTQWAHCRLKTFPYQNIIQTQVWWTVTGN